MGQFEAADLLRHGAGERSLLVAEQLAFQQVAGMAAQLTFTKLPSRPGCNGEWPGDQLLAGARSPEDEHRRVSGRDDV